MKVKACKEEMPKLFVPVNITITLESKQELGAFYSIFNHAAIHEAILQFGLLPGNIMKRLNELAEGSVDYISEFNILKNEFKKYNW